MSINNIDVTKTGLAPAIVESILAVARQRAALLQSLREALEREDIAAVQRFARQLCGLEESCGRLDLSD